MAIRVLCIWFIIIVPYVSRADANRDLPAGYQLAASQRPKKFLRADLAQLNTIFSKMGFKPADSALTGRIPWLEVNQVYLPSDFASAVFVLCEVRSKSMLTQNRLYSLDNESKIISLGGAGLPICTLVIWRMDEQQSEEILKNIKRTGFTDFAHLLAIESAEAEEAIPSSREGAASASGESKPWILGNIGSCLVSGFAAAGHSSRSTLSSLGAAFTGNWLSPREAWAAVKERWQRFRDFVGDFNNQVSSSMGNGSAAIRKLLLLPATSISKIVCAAIGSFTPAALMSVVVAGATLKLASNIINAIKGLERFATLISLLDRLKLLGNEAFLNGSKKIEEFMVKVLSGRVPEEKLAKIESIGRNHPSLALKYASCLP